MAATSAVADGLTPTSGPRLLGDLDHFRDSDPELGGSDVSGSVAGQYKLGTILAALAHSRRARPLSPRRARSRRARPPRSSPHRTVTPKRELHEATGASPVPHARFSKVSPY